jgi:hypothetical protein
MSKKANPRNLDFAKKDGAIGEIERGKERRSTRVRRHHYLNLDIYLYIKSRLDISKF